MLPSVFSLAYPLSVADRTPLEKRDQTVGEHARITETNPALVKLNTLSDVHLRLRARAILENNADPVILATDVARPKEARSWALGFASRLTETGPRVSDELKLLSMISQQPFAHFKDLM